MRVSTTYQFELTKISATSTTIISATTQIDCLATDIALDTMVVRRPDVTIGPDYDQIGLPGSIITYVHTLTNTGGIPDGYQIDYASSPGWNVLVQPSSVVTLPVGATIEVTASVEIPAEVLSGTGHTLIITATSNRTSKVFDTASTRTRVGYLPSAVLLPDQSGSAVPGH